MLPSHSTGDLFVTSEVKCKYEFIYSHCSLFCFFFFNIQSFNLYTELKMMNVCASFTFILIKSNNLRESGSTCSRGNTSVLCVYPSRTAHTRPHDVLWDDGSSVVCWRRVPKQHLAARTSQQQPRWPLQGPEGSAGTLAAVRSLEAQLGVQSGVFVNGPLGDHSLRVDEGFLVEVGYRCFTVCSLERVERLLKFFIGCDTSH